MPYRVLKLATRYSLLGLLIASAVLAVALRAAESSSPAAGVSESFTQIAERFGLWAAMCVVLVCFSVWALYQNTMFVHRTLVRLVEANQRCIDRNTDALREAPCGYVAAQKQDRDGGGQATGG